MGFSMNKDEDRKRVYRQPLNYENGVILPKIRDISLWRDTNIKAYESGVLTLALLLPHELRTKTLTYWRKDDDHHTAFEDLTMAGKIDFDDLFVYILKILEDNNICFPKISYHEGRL